MLNCHPNHLTSMYCSQSFSYFAHGWSFGVHARDYINKKKGTMKHEHISNAKPTIFELEIAISIVAIESYIQRHIIMAIIINSIIYKQDMVIWIFLSPYSLSQNPHLPESLSRVCDKFRRTKQTARKNHNRTDKIDNFERLF